MAEGYEESMDALQELLEDEVDPVIQEALEKALDAMGTVGSLWNLFRSNGGMDIPEEPDGNLLENTVDAYFCELLAATQFLAQKEFGDMPKLIRNTGVKIDEKFSGAMPRPVIKGYGRLAARIEKYQELTKQADVEITEILEKKS